MGARRRGLLMNGNRALIFFLTLTGMSMDGLEHSDIILALAVIFWLWLPYWIHLEGKLLQQIEEVTHDE